MNVIESLRNNLSDNIFYLYLNRLLVQIAFGLLTGFGILFFFEKFNGSIVYVLLLSSALHLTFALGNHISARLIKIWGMRNMMIVALFFLIVVFISRVFWEYNPILILAIYFFTFSVYKSLYWVPYHVEFASFTDKKTRGKQVALLYNIGDMFAASLPFISGLIISASGYNTLFITGCIFVMLSIFPLFKINQTRENYTWSFNRLVQELFQKENRGVVLSNLGNGLQMTVSAVVWPIFIFIVTEGDYVKFGAILALVAIFMIFLRYIVGKYMDKVGREKVVKVGNTVYFTGWILKAFIQSVTGIFVVDIYHRLGNVVNKLSFDVSVYDQAADNGRYIDEYTLLKEFSTLIGRFIMPLVLIPVIFYFNIQVAFIFGALATLLMNLINRAQKVG